jgi:hypothetical protein
MPLTRKEIVEIRKNENKKTQKYLIWLESVFEKKIDG